MKEFILLLKWGKIYALKNALKSSLKQWFVVRFDSMPWNGIVMYFIWNSTAANGNTN